MAPGLVQLRPRESWHTSPNSMPLAQDLRYAIRALARRPALVATTTFSLSVAIAANAIMFDVVDRLLLRPPSGVTEPKNVKRINYTSVYEGKSYAGPVTTYRTIIAMRESGAFQSVAGVGGATWTLGLGTEAQSVQVALVNASYFPLLGLRAQAGRFFTADEDSIPRGAAVAVLADRFWRNRMGGSTDAVGKVLHLEGKPYTVIGIAPEGFQGLDDSGLDVIVPISAAAPDQIGPAWYSQPNSFWVSAIARLKPGSPEASTVAQATTAYRAEVRSWGRRGSDTTSRVVLGSIIGARTPNGVSAPAKVSLWLMGVSVAVLLIACANVANILLVRTMERQREIAVRLAMGAGASRLVGQLLTEAAVLAGFAALCALAITAWGSRLVRATLLGDVPWSSAVFDARVLGFTLGIATLCTLGGGLVPALTAARTSVFDALRESARTAGAGHHRLRLGLLILQTALSVLLVIGAGLFVKSLRNVAGRDLGIDKNHTAFVMMSLSRFGFQPPQVEELYRSAAERVSRVPGVTSVALVKGTVPFRSATAMGFTIPGKDKLPNLPGGGPYMAGVTSDYFRTLGARIARGRGFSATEERTNSHVVLINDIVARAYWPDEDPIGKCMKFMRDSTCSTVIGVTQNIVLFSVIRDDRGMLYLSPLHPLFGAPAALIYRTAGDPGAVEGAVRREIQSLAPNMPFVNIAAFSKMIGGQLRTWRLGATMLTLYGSVALLIAAIGLYGLLAYWVSQRTREIGVRMALGAQPGDVVRLVLVQSAVAVAAGVALGVLAAVGGSRWIAEMLYETSPRDVASFATAAAVVAVMSAVASIIPALRSASVDPVIALRSD